MCTLLTGLPEEFPVPIVLVQHRSRDSKELTSVLQDCSRLKLRDIEDKMRYEKGCVYVAPPDYHTLVDADHFALSVDAPVNFSRPSIDVLFESAADQLATAVIGIVLTGASRDGARGLRRIVDRGGHVIVQDPTGAEMAIMPQGALEAVPGACVLPLEAMAPYLTRMLEGASRWMQV